MKYGFDLDGTLDHPALAALANELYEAGHEIHVITVGALVSVGYYAARPKKIAKLEALGVKYHKLHVVGGANYSEAGCAKADVINAEGIEVMYDDAPTFCAMILKYAPQCLVLQVRFNHEENHRR